MKRRACRAAANITILPACLYIIIVVIVTTTTKARLIQTIKHTYRCLGLFATPNTPVPSRLVPFRQPPVASAAALWPLVPPWPTRFPLLCLCSWLRHPTRIKGRNEAVAADGSFISLQSPIFFFPPTSACTIDLADITSSL